MVTQRLWHEIRDVRLREIKNDTLRWTDQGSTTVQRVLIRLRIGHTRLTHTFLLKREKMGMLRCGTIGDVRNIILESREFGTERQENSIDTTSIRSALKNDEVKVENLLKFLLDTKLYQQLKRKLNCTIVNCKFNLTPVRMHSLLS